MRKWSKTLIGSVGLALALASPAEAQAAWQCAPFARLESGIQLFGAAFGWWQQAIGKYAQGTIPKIGSVLVFKAAGAMRSGHVAVVSKVVSDRIIKVTHANWSLIGGHRGQVERDVTVVDASDDNDWSKVKVWYAPIHDLGLKAYPVYGFIYKNGDGSADTASGEEASQIG